MKALIFMSFYFESFVRTDAISRLIRANVHQILCKSREKCKGEISSD
jgi:hypothetical protein